MQHLDARGLICPMPVLKARKKLIAMAPGERLAIVVTDPQAPKDFALFCAEAGHRLVSEEKREGTVEIVVERGAT